MRLIVEEEFLDDVGLVAETQDEILVPVLAVIAHQVPDDRLAADRDHRLGNVFGIVADPGAETSAEQDCFHRRGLIRFSDRRCPNSKSYPNSKNARPVHHLGSIDPRAVLLTATLCRVFQSGDGETSSPMLQRVSERPDPTRLSRIDRTVATSHFDAINSGVDCDSARSAVV